MKRPRGRPTTEVMALQGQMAELERVVHMLANYTVEVAATLHHCQHGARSWSTCMLAYCGRTKGVLQNVAMHLPTGAKDLMDMASDMVPEVAIRRPLGVQLKCKVVAKGKT